MEMYFKTREDWRNWLEENHKNPDGIWFVFFKKKSRKPSVLYKDAVEEALCFGWIDSKIISVIARIAKILDRSEKNIKSPMM
jgi:uncharacterized protein YdeI (YjbR/CyaY-like superfamily)